MKRDLLKIVTVIAIIFTMTMANFIFLCAYAADELTRDIKTNHKNVEFTATLKQAEKESTALDAKMNSEDLQIHFSISVKQEGYFNGEITLENSNFKFKHEILSEGITGIEDNKITLSQVNAGETRDIIVGIDVIKPDKISLDMLEKESTLKLGGIYRDSTEKDISIKGERKVTLNLTSPYDESNQGIILEHQMITNKVVNYNGEQKRIIQFAVTSGMENNLFPIKSVKIETNSPKIEDKYAETVMVNSNNTLASTGKELTDEDWEYDSTTGKLQIAINNEVVDDNVVWNKSGNDVFIVTYIYNEVNEIATQEIETNSEISLYDKNETKITKQFKNQISQEDLDSMVTVDISNGENEIYKGKLLAGIDREFSENVTVGTNIVGVVDSFSLVEGYNNLDFANVYSTQTTIVKDDMLKTLGEDGTIEIYNAETSEIIARISKGTQTDESGNVVVTYPENVRLLRFEFSGIKNQGKIRITNKKIMKNNNQLRLQTTEGFDYVIGGEYFNKNVKEAIGTIQNEVSTIKLLNTETSARLEINKTELSAMSNNENVEIRAILQTRDEKNELFKNPIIEITLPQQVTNINVKSLNLLYENELTISNYSVERNRIIVYLTGEQTQYKEQAIEGAEVIINTDITVDRKAGNSEQSVKLAYSNEKAVNYQNGATHGETEQKINIVSYAGVVSIAEVPEYGVEVINNEGNKTGRLELGADAKTTTMSAEILNNTEGTISDVEVLGTFPTNGAVQENNINSKVSPISVSGSEEQGATVYYSLNPEATSSLDEQQNAWTQEFTEDAKKYLIVIDNLDMQESTEFQYQTSIPERLEYNAVAKQNFETTYVEDTTGMEKSSNVDFITLETGAGPVVETTLEAVVGSEVSNSVKEGEVLTYRLNVSNTGSETVSNISLQGSVPDGMVYIKEVSDEEASQMTSRGYQEYPDQKTVDFQIDKLEPGETAVREYQVRVQKGASANIENKVTFTYGEVVKESNVLTTEVQQGNLQITLYGVDKAGDVEPGYAYRYAVELKNLSDETLSNLVLQANLENADLQRIMYFTENAQTVISTENTITLEQLAPGETKTISIYTQIPVFTDDEVRQLKVSADVSVNDETYKTNEKIVNINAFNIEVTNISENSGGYVKPGENITYKIKMTNNGLRDINNITLKDKIVREVSLVSVSKDGQQLTENDYSIEQDLEGDGEFVIVTDALTAGESREYTIVVVVNAGIANQEAMQLVNLAEVSVGPISIGQASVTHVLEPEKVPEPPESLDPDPEEPTDPDPEEPTDPDPEEPTDPDPEEPTDPDPEEPTDPDPEEPTDPDPEKPTDPDPEEPTDPDPEEPTDPDPGITEPEEENRLISGIAWFDANENGQKDQNETLIAGVTVRLLDITTNEFVKGEDGRDISAITNNSGFYTLSEVPQGRYVVIFEYDTSKYVLTTYNQQGVDTQFTSKAVDRKVTIEGEERNVGGTEVIEISDSNIANINIGLREAKEFDLRLDKYVSKVIIQNTQGTTNLDFGESTMAKAEIDAKLVNATSVIVEYKIKITNEGEAEGYVRKIVDYLSSDYKFSSELNSDWYQSGGKLYNTSLANEKIQPGETKEITLTVTKQLTDNNMGLISNTAEIEEAYNEQGLQDKDSTPANNTAGEDDYGKADLILSIKTGQVVATVSIIVLSTLIIVAGAIGITKIVMKRKII